MGSRRVGLWRPERPSSGQRTFQHLSCGPFPCTSSYIFEIVLYVKFCALHFLNVKHFLMVLEALHKQNIHNMLAA